MQLNWEYFKINVQVGLHDVFIDALSCYVYNSTLATWHLLHNFMSIPILLVKSDSQILAILYICSCVYSTVL